MDYTEILINIVDKAQALYEWLVRFVGYAVDLFIKFKDFILELAYTIKEKLQRGDDDIEIFLKNYIENEHSFI